MACRRWQRRRQVLKFVPLCNECVLGDHEIDAVLYAGCKYEDYEARRDAVYGLLRRSTILALLCIGRRSDLLIAFCLFLLVFYYELLGL